MVGRQGSAFVKSGTRHDDRDNCENEARRCVGILLAPGWEGSDGDEGQITDVDGM